ncbi:MAG: hypothetical protein K2J93_02290, partial [Anaeroplasmataceae bacterium]|nr:hypothetical protein [Anaeroplasmataceae bacterium]
MKKHASLIQYFYNEHNIWNWEEKHEADLKLLDKLPNAIANTITNNDYEINNLPRAEKRNFELENKL